MTILVAEAGCNLADSVSRWLRSCAYCGAPGGDLCAGHDDLPALDSQRAPELYLATANPRRMEGSN